MKTLRRIDAAPTMRDRILDAAERLLARYGYQKTTMDDLAREAGIGKRTIYLHFASKEEVALSSIDRIVDRLTERLRAVAASDLPPDRRVREMLLLRVLFRFDSVHDYHHNFDDRFSALRPAYLARRQRYFDAEAAVFVEVLREGRDAGLFACDDARAAAQTLLLATNALLPSNLSVRELGKRSEVEAKTARIADLLLTGLVRRQAP
jgi:AcrR family transcriptional regulator